MDQRQLDLAAWTGVQLFDLGLARQSDPADLQPVSGDASNRRYFRSAASSPVGLFSSTTLAVNSVICVDAPPKQEDSRPFIAIAESWSAANIPVPRVLAQDLSQGFMLLSDFGNTLYLDRLDSNTADALYSRAMQVLLQIQRNERTSGRTQDYDLPPYDAALLQREMGLCPEWFLTGLLQIELSSADNQLLSESFQRLQDSALQQPQVCVHRDYHSRNLMLLEDNSVGVLDFQDAVMGPVTYDLVSLLRDCYISWPLQQERQWLHRYYCLVAEAGLVETAATGQTIDYAQFERWFDWMGLQRHLKCVGIFARLYLRDSKPGYLPDIPRTFAYIQRVCDDYDELAPLAHWLQERVVPAMQDNAALFLPKEPG